MTDFEAETPHAALLDDAALDVVPAHTAVRTAPDTAAEAAPVKRRAPRRPGKPDVVLAAAVEAARDGLRELAADDQVGEHVSITSDAERLVTHRFESKLPGYRGWQWFATLARVPRGKIATVCEIGLLPSPASLVAPDWVPWAERVRPEEVAAAHEAEEAEAKEAEAKAAGTAEAAQGEGAQGEAAPHDGADAAGNTPQDA